MPAPSIDRRAFLRRSAVGLAGLAALGGAPFASPRGFRTATGLSATSDRFTVEKIERTTLRVPYREIPERAMSRELPHWKWTEVFEVTLGSGATGVGETLLWYTWGRTDDADVARAKGASAVELLWDDSLGAGLQMALFDAVATTAGVPIHRLLGRQVHETTPLSWWNIDTSPEDMASECKTALEAGYTSYKTKGRPWFDVWEQVAMAAEAVPESFKIDMDFNDTLLDADRALPILKDLETYEQIDIYESPIPQGDVAGNKRIREETRVQIAMHYGNPPPAVVAREGCCDGFVVGGGASRVLEAGRFAGEVGMPFWLQLVGTGITAAYSLHFGAVLRQAVWPAVNCHQLYRHDLLADPIVVEAGRAKVPTTPGLGHAIDREKLAEYRVEQPAERPDPPRLVVTSWPDGRKMYFRSTGVNFHLRAGIRGEIPFYERGVTTTLWPDDGTDAFRAMYERAKDGPLRED